MNRRTENEAPYVHGQEAGFGVAEDAMQDPSHQMGYQQIEEDSVGRVPRNRIMRALRAIPMPLMLAGAAVPAFWFFRRRKRAKPQAAPPA
ncbi:MAG: hypothetical protein GEU28_04130 [Dehalococcoidia bacterium]|nr:hypothetical protein [Dehalococcoidia bacterium]